MTSDPIQTKPAFSQQLIVRFGATFFTNVLRLVLSFLSGLVVARGLGAAGFGDLSFLLGSFAAINQILDMGTSPAYFTFVSQRKRRLSFFVVYLIWTIGIQFVGTVVVLWLLLPERATREIWPGQSRGIVLLAFGVSFMTGQIWTMVSQLGEALRKTIVVQAVAATQAILHLLLVIVARYSGWLSLKTVMWLLIAEYAALALFLGLRFFPASITKEPEDHDRIRFIVKGFLDYCRPLVLYGFVGFLYHFADRWLLQSFGGSRQQGFFSIGQQFSTISLFATTSILNVFWKEIAEARERNDRQREEKLYKSVRRGLFFFSAWISCLLIPYSPEMIKWLLGPDYFGASLALSIMLLYPIHQSVGQIQGTVFYATGHTQIYSRIGILTMLISIPASYLMLAPRTATIPGLNLGAVGLASKMVGLQLLGVALFAHQLKRMYGWSGDYLYQVAVLLILLGLGFAGRLVFGRIAEAAVPLGQAAMVFTGMSFYVACSAVVLWFRPTLIGIPRADLQRWLEYRPHWMRPVSVVNPK
jgi:O-antigen/teichoic acid export membrane protein